MRHELLEWVYGVKKLQVRGFCSRYGVKKLQVSARGSGFLLEVKKLQVWGEKVTISSMVTGSGFLLELCRDF